MAVLRCATAERGIWHMAETLLALITAHLLGDFVLQTRRMVEQKKQFSVLLLHVLIVTALTALALRNLHRVILPVIFLSHLLFDGIKIRIRKHTFAVFMIDQMAHLIVTAVLAGFFPQASANGWWPESLSHLLPWLYTAMCLLSGVILIVPVGGIVIGKLTEPIRAEAEKIAILSTDNLADAPSAARGQHLIAGLRNGGRYIGWLERTLVLLLILIGQPSGIGFLITAKSLLRLGEIRESKDRKLAEYIIIGTFLSFGWSLVWSVSTQNAIDYWRPRQPATQAPLRVLLEQAPPA